MTWVLFQRIANFLIFYGADIVQIYTGLMKMAEKQLSMKVDLVWLPVVILVVVHILFGVLAGVYRDWETDRKSTRLNSSHITRSRMPSSA